MQLDRWKDAVRRLREARSKHTTNLANNLKEWVIDDAEFMREMVDALRSATCTDCWGTASEDADDDNDGDNDDVKPAA